MTPWHTLLFILGFTSCCIAESPRSLGEELLIHVDEKLHFKPTKDEFASHGYLSDITFTETTSSPKSFIVEGHIKHSNNGAALERVPIYIGQDKESMPILAAMTNCVGNFKFRLWIKEDERTHQVQTSKDFSGYLYAMGSFEKLKFQIGSYTQRYSLKALKLLSDKDAEQDAAPNP